MDMSRRFFLSNSITYVRRTRCSVHMEAAGERPTLHFPAMLDKEQTNRLCAGRKLGWSDESGGFMCVNPREG